VTGPSNFAFAGWERVGEAGEFLVGNVAQEPQIADESIAPEMGSHPVDYRRTAIVAPEGFEDLRMLEGSLSDVSGKVEGRPPRYDAMGFHVVSDRPARIYRTNWVGMGVLVGPGESTIQMQFSTPGFHTGIAVSLLSLALWCGAGFSLQRRL
jgi:hypothetical protein